jgi:hypothetical protein
MVPNDSHETVGKKLDTYIFKHQLIVLETAGMKKNSLVYIALIFWFVLMMGRIFALGLFTHLLPLIAPKEDLFARQYIALLKTGDIARADTYLSPVLSPQAQNDLFSVGDYLNRCGDLDSIHLLNVSYTKIDKGKKQAKVLSYYADFQKGSLLIRVMLFENGDGFSVSRFNYEPLSESFENAVSFKVGDRSWIQYLFLLSAVLMAVFTFWVLAECIDSRVRWKWFWIPFILVGVGRIGLVWNGSTWRETVLQLNWFGFQLFSGGLVRTSVFQPWTICVSLPLGAIIYYFTKRKINKTSIE